MARTHVVTDVDSMQTETSGGKDVVSGCDAKIWEPGVSQVSDTPFTSKAELKEFLDQPIHEVGIAPQTIPDASLQLSHAQGGLLQLLEGLHEDGSAHDVFHGFQAPAGGLMFDQGPHDCGAFVSMAEPALPSDGLEVGSHGVALDPAMLEHPTTVANPEVVIDPKMEAANAVVPAAVATQSGESTLQATSGELPSSMEKRKRGRPKGSKNRPKEERGANPAADESDSLYPLSAGPLPPAAAFNWGPALSLGNPNIFNTMGPLGSLLASSLAQPHPGAPIQPFGVPFSGHNIQAPSRASGQPQALPRKRGRPPKVVKLDASATVSSSQAPAVMEAEAAGSGDILQDAARSATSLGSSPQAIQEESGASPEVESSEEVREEPGSRTESSDQGLEKPPAQTAEEVEKDLLDRYGAESLERYPILREQFTGPSGPPVVTGPSLTLSGRRRGRPPGSKNKPKASLGGSGMSQEPRVPKKRGRPLGSKNKPRGEYDVRLGTSNLAAVASLPFPFNVSNPFMAPGPVPEAMNPAMVAALAASLAANPLTAAYANLAAAFQHPGMVIPQATSPPARKKGRPPGSKNKPKPMPVEPVTIPNAGKESPGAEAAVEVDGATTAEPVGWPSLGMAVSSAFEAGVLQPTSVIHALQSTSTIGLMPEGVVTVEDLGPPHDGFAQEVGERMERDEPQENGLEQEVGELMGVHEHEQDGLMQEVVGADRDILDIQLPEQDMMMQAHVEGVKPYQGEGESLAST